MRRCRSFSAAPALLIRLTALLAAAACGTEDAVTDPIARAALPALAVVGGDGQSGAPGTMLPEPIVVRVREEAKGADFRPVPGMVLNWVVTQGGGSTYVTATQTDAKGESRNWWTLGPQSGVQTLEIRAVNPTTGERVVFAVVNATAVAPARWRVIETAPVGFGFGDIWGSPGSGQVHMSGPRDGTISLFDGATWQQLPSNTTNGINALFGFSNTEIYAVGGNFAGSVSVLRFDGTSWSQMPNVPQDAFATDVWGTSPTDLLVTRVETSVMRFDGDKWTVSQTPATGRLESVWGFSSNDVYAVGGMGNILHFDGTSWVRMSSGTDIGLNDIWGPGPRDVFAVGGAGTVVRFSGETWTRMETGTTKHLFAVWGTSSHDVMAVGEDGTILHFDGTMWRSLESGTTKHLLGIWGDSPSNYYATGGLFGWQIGSVVLRYSP